MTRLRCVCVCPTSDDVSLNFNIASLRCASSPGCEFLKSLSSDTLAAWVRGVRSALWICCRSGFATLPLAMSHCRSIHTQRQFLTHTHDRSKTHAEPIFMANLAIYMQKLFHLVPSQRALATYMRVSCVRGASSCSPGTTHTGKTRWLWCHKSDCTPRRFATIAQFSHCCWRSQNAPKRHSLQMLCIAIYMHLLLWL